MSGKEDLFKMLEEISSEQKEITDALLEKLGTITERLINIIKDHGLTDDLGLFDCRGYGFRWKGSSHGEWIHFCSLHSSGSKIIPREATDIGKTFYYHYDYNYLTEYMSRSEVMTLCEIVPEFIKNMMAKIQTLTDREREYLEKIARCCE